MFVDATVVAGLAVIILIVYQLVTSIYNVFFHPLRSFPGPWINGVSRLPYTISMLSGRLPHSVSDLHQHYGPIVRVAPNELAFSDPSSWKDIMGGGSNDLAKWSAVFGIPECVPPHLQSTTDKDYHKTLRRAVAPGFSSASLRAQESVVIQYLDQLIRVLEQRCQAGEKNSTVIDFERWYRFTVFDIIGDLALGESFGCLETGDFHAWLKFMNDASRVMWILASASMYPVLKYISNWLFWPVAVIGIEQQNRVVRPIMERRIAKGTDRLDLINPIIMKKDEWSLSSDDMISHATVFIGAGSETTAGILTGVTSLLLDHPEKWQRLATEVRSAFSSEADITLDSVNDRLPYLIACLEETHRMYPQSGSPSLRITGRNDIICGIPVPPQTVVGVWIWSMYRDPKLFADPNNFHPERFMGDPQFEHDSRDALKPFFTGTRDCIGQTLATLELRIILARIVFKFDLELQMDSKQWLQGQKNLFVVWNKPPMHVRLRPVVPAS